MSEKKLELIAQMLRKAERTDNPAEAEAFSAAAEKLMIKYGIEQAVIDARLAGEGKVTEQIVQRTIKFSGAYRLEYIRIGSAVCRGLGSLRTLMSTYKNREATLYIIGYESDVERAITLISSLQLQAVVAVKAWWKEHKLQYMFETSYDQEAARRSFVTGFASGAGARIRNNRAEQVKEAEQASAGTELVLVSRDSQVQAHYDAMSKGVSRSRGGKGSGSAMTQGYDAGQKANTGERGVSQGRGISA